MSFSFIKNSSLLLILIIFLAAFLRFYQLGVTPPSLSWDEVAWGYNAYSVGIDGRDEFGHLLPYTSFISFGDYKPPVYAYLTVVPVWIFGLTAYAVRFPSALFGTLTVVVTYFLVKELFYNAKQKYVEYIALMSALIMAVSPWNIMLSRAAFEANVASFFIVTGVWLFLYAVRKKPMVLIVSVICFVASIYTFNSTRVVAPLLFVVLAVGNYKALLHTKKATIIAAVIGLVLLLPVVPFLLSPQARLRYQEVNIFSDITVVQTANQEIANDHNAWWSKIIHNRRVAYTTDFVQHYLDNFSPTFLFITGDPNQKFSTQDVGQMYLWDVPFFVIGILFLFRKKEGKWWIIPLWLLIGIIPAAVARETPHALRTESTLPTWQILTAYGFVTVLFAIHRYRQWFVGGFFILLFGWVSYFLHGYYTHYSKEYSGVWQYGYAQAIEYVKAHQEQYDKVYISNIDRPYIYTLFYLQYPPQQFRKTAKVYTDTFGFVHVDSFGKYDFSANPPSAKTTSKILYITDVAKVPQKVKVLQTFYRLDGTPAIVAYTR